MVPRRPSLYEYFTLALILMIFAAIPLVVVDAVTGDLNLALVSAVATYAVVVVIALVAIRRSRVPA
jgi:hypothetical protein